MAKRSVFIVGLDDFNLDLLKRLPQASECTFEPALTFAEMRDPTAIDVRALIETATQRLERHAGPVDGVGSFFDFPGTLIAAILAERFSLPGPTLESVFKCEHKYWSRLEQQKVVREHIPQFRAFDPFDEEAFRKLDLVPPFWIKPIKSFRSYLAYNIQDERHFNHVMEVCRDRLGYIVEPFRALMADYAMPAEITGMAETFIAESPIGGAQCTLEGYVYQGRVVGYGVVDSIREPNSSSFSRYEYPSSLPLEIQHRMIDVARSALLQIGYDNAPFNAEFFYDQTADQVWLLEINTRLSQSHADMFEKVNGVSHLSVLVDLALGRKPKTLDRKGKSNLAANFFLRAFEDGRVVRVPTAEALRRFQQRQPGTRIKIDVAPGNVLSELPTQDSYSYELAHIHIGGRDQVDVLDKYDEALGVLQFEIEREKTTL